MSGGGKQLKLRDEMVLLRSRFVNVTGREAGLQYSGQRGLPGGASGVEAIRRYNV